MQEEEPQGPSFPKPWYYRPEYMFPMLIFWPAGSILVLRSPWNNNTMVGGLAWASIIVLGVLGVRWLNDGIYQPIMLFHVPGILLTIVTQVQWAVYRHQMAEEYGSPGEGPEAVSPSGPEEANPPRPSARRRRRNPRAGRTKN